jgi:CRP/FNR family transcriptional regulator
MSAGLTQVLSELNGANFSFKPGAIIPAETIVGRTVFLQSGLVKFCDKSGVLIFRLLPGEILDADLSEELNLSSGDSIIEAETAVVFTSLSPENQKTISEENTEWSKSLKSSRKALFRRLIGSVCSTNSCMESQIIKYLNNLREISNSDEIPVTHAVIAKDLGSAREVVSRGLKKLENEGKLQLKRGKIVMK